MAPWIAALARLALAVPVALGATTCTATAKPPRSTAAVAATQTPLRGADISWPNCPKGLGIKHKHTQGEPLPGRNARFVIVGVTNGPGFYPNPCLTDELAWVETHHRMLGGYALTTYPTKKQLALYGGSGPFNVATETGELKNAGYAEAAFNVATMRQARMSVPMLWVDIEPYQYWPWSHSHAANRAVIRGVIREYREAGYPVGIYTYLNGWSQTVGDWRRPAIPTWSTAGRRNQRHARAMCTLGPSSGATWIAQWYSSTQDFDLLCPAAPSAASLFTPPPAG